MWAVKSAGSPRYVQVSGPKCTSGMRVHFRTPKQVLRNCSVAAMSETTQAIWVIGPGARASTMCTI